LSILSDADNETPEKIDRTWFGRLHQTDPAKAVEIETLIREWWNGRRRDKFPSYSSLARFIKRYDIDVSVQEITKTIRGMGG
jgi:hypothetical protein